MGHAVPPCGIVFHLKLDKPGQPLIGNIPFLHQTKAIPIGYSTAYFAWLIQIIIKRNSLIF